MKSYLEKTEEAIEMVIKEREEKRSDKDILDFSDLSDEEAYKTVKAIYNSLKNCNKDMSFKDAKHWSISIS